MVESTEVLEKVDQKKHWQEGGSPHCKEEDIRNGRKKAYAYLSTVAMTPNLSRPSFPVLPRDFAAPLNNEKDAAPKQL